MLGFVPQPNLRALGVKAAHLELTTEQGLEPEDGCLGQTAPIVATGFFPLCQADLIDAGANVGARCTEPSG